MPTYEYVCKSCAHGFEIHQAFTDDALTTCPECGGPLRKVFGNIGITFKGSGFYKTDSRGSSKGSAGSASSADSSSGSSSTDSGSSSSGSGSGASPASDSSSASTTPAPSTPAAGASSGSGSGSGGSTSKPAP